MFHRRSFVRSNSGESFQCPEGATRPWAVLRAYCRRPAHRLARLALVGLLSTLFACEYSGAPPTELDATADVTVCEQGTFADGASCEACAAIAGCEAVTCTGRDDSTCVACASGLSLSAEGCRDRDDCTDEPCGPGGTCSDAGADRYSCACAQGYFEAGTTCEACAAVDGCDDWSCTGASDSACLQCALGYHDNGVGGCQPDSGCAPEPCGDGTCVATAGGLYTCDCPAGRYDDGVTCSPCASVAHCAEVICAAAAGSLCAACESGFVLAEGGAACVDGDDCTPNPCGSGTCADLGANLWECRPTDGFDNALGGDARVATSLGVFLASAGPQTFVDAQGAAVVGMVYLAVNVDGFTGGFVTADGQAFTPSVMADITFDDALGNPLAVAPGHDVALVLPLPGGADGAAAPALGAELPLRYHLESTSSWEIESVGSVVAHEGALGVSAIARHFTWYAVGLSCDPIADCALTDCGAPRCERCTSGYAVTPDGAGCVAVDDCVDHDCAPGACVDGDAAYACECPEGTYGDGTPSCLLCAPSARAGCVAVACEGPGASLCVGCAAGFTLVAGDCVDIDDCRQPDPCGAGACTDTGPGTVVCDCPDGMFGDGTAACVLCSASDVPACTAVTCSQAGASTCSACGSGYRLAGGLCLNVDDCAGHQCGAGTCIDGLSGYACECPDGSFGDGTVACTACTPSTVAGCTAVTCTRAGTSTCSACGAGYGLVQGRCVDLDDCAHQRCAPGVCVDALNAFSCNCPDGTFGDGTTACTPCSPTTTPGCGAVACVAAGASICSACMPGYVFAGGACVEAIDCTGNPCAPGTCTDTGVNVFACSCPDGRYGDGTTSCLACPSIAGCTTLTCTQANDSTCTACLPGYALSAGRCVDIVDDCAGHLCGIGICVDSGNGYTCSCPDGMYGDGTTACATCAAIDHCGQVGCSNGADQACLVCASGYEVDGAGGCRFDWCQLGTDDCDDQPDACSNGDDGAVCVCPPGATGNGHGSSGCSVAESSLSGLTTSIGNLSPAFSPDIDLYTLELPDAATELTFAPFVVQPQLATITVDDGAVASGASVRVAVIANLQTVAVSVTAISSQTRTYTVTLVRARTYVKASNTGPDDWFGCAVDISSDGSTLAVGAWFEESAATGIDGDQADNSAPHSGAVYVYHRVANHWVQQAYVKASNTDADDWFGFSVALSADGSMLAVGAPLEFSNAKGIDGDQSDNSASYAGAVYMFQRSGGSWAQTAYIKASNNRGNAQFGVAVALSSDGSRLAVGAKTESSGATGVDGDDSTSATYSGAAYLYTRAGGDWSEEAYVKASNTGAFDYFGSSVALSRDGLTLAVGATDETSNATGINGSQSDNSLPYAGAVYIFSLTGEVWSQQAYLKASYAGGDYFGESVALSDDGSTLAVGAYVESSAAIGINGDPSDASAMFSGASYVFTRAGSTWSQQAYVKASDTAQGHNFGKSVAVSASGSMLAVGAPGAGAIYLFRRAGSTWSQLVKVISKIADSNANFGDRVALSPDGSTLAVAAPHERSNATGIDGDQSDASAPGSGALFVYRCAIDTDE